MVVTLDHPFYSVAQSEDFDLNAVEIETQVELVAREGNGIGLAFQGGYGIVTIGGEADEIEFGPILELAQGPLILTLNPLFTNQVGSDAETDGLGFEYGWRAEYAVASHWGIGVEMFGEIEELSHSGSFDDQTHSIGPTLFYKPGEDDSEGNEENEDDEDVLAGPPELEISANVGVQFGLTDVTSDTAVKFQGTLAFRLGVDSCGSLFRFLA
ncbi:MAG: hypothetical protein ACREDO_08095 [Methyloceanibacter sp.]